MQYRIVENTNSMNLSKEVKALLAAGWKLQGGVSVGYGESSRDSNCVFAQAMVRKRLSD